MIKQIFSKIPRKQSKSGGSSPKGTKKRSEGNKKVGDLGHTVLPANNSLSTSGNATLDKFYADGLVINASYEALPSFRVVQSSEKQNLLIRKLRMCCVVFDFNDLTKSLKEKEVKRNTLLELVEYIMSSNVKFNETVMQEIIQMVSLNLFRDHSPPPREYTIIEGVDGEDEEPPADPAWPHLEIVYEFLLRFVASPETDAKIAKRFLDSSFVSKLLDLFDSEDPKERDYVKTILHRIYGKFMVHRPFIRKTINNIFFRFIFETEKHNGVAELLEILGSIINGFALPLKEEHKLFMVRVLIPLHRPRCLAMYHQQLSYCITQFVEKDGKLADIIVRGLLKFWPVTSSSKEIMFLNELEEVLEATQPPEFQRCMVPLFHQIARCLNSSHFQVAERTLFLWNNDHIENLIKQNRKVILPIIFPALERNARHHWNQAVHGLTLNIRKVFYDLDFKLYEECMCKFQEDESKEDDIRARREATWKRLEKIAAEKSANKQAVIVP